MMTAYGPPLVCAKRGRVRTTKASRCAHERFDVAVSHAVVEPVRPDRPAPALVSAVVRVDARGSRPPAPGHVEDLTLKARCEGPRGILLATPVDGKNLAVLVDPGPKIVPPFELEAGHSFTRRLSSVQLTHR